MKILAQYNRSLEESEDEWVLVEMLGHEVFIQMEYNGDEYDLNTYTLETMKRNFPKTLGLLMKNKNDRAISEEFAKEKKSQEDYAWEMGR